VDGCGVGETVAEPAGPLASAAAAALVVAGGLVRPRAAVATAGAAAAVVLVAGEPDLTPYAPALTTEHHEIWTRVEDIVPVDGLVFTSLTGPTVTVDTGWNYYAPTAGRQLYVAGWSNSRLLVDLQERARRLGLNDDVLTGRRAPAEVPLERDYSAFYAVLRTGATAPPGARRVAGDDAFVLYRLSG
jgi:hypothetical protein